MRKIKASSPSHPIGLLFIGLLLAQILATTQVYLSNINLYATVSAANAAGYLTVPNQEVMGSLQNLTAAFLGGLFFTFTLGTAITLGTIAGAWIWVRVFQSNKFALLVFLSVWAAALVSVNIHGFCLFIVAVIFFSLFAKKYK